VFIKAAPKSFSSRDGAGKLPIEYFQAQADAHTALLEVRGRLRRSNMAAVKHGLCTLLQRCRCALELQRRHPQLTPATRGLSSRLPPRRHIALFSRCRSLMALIAVGVDCCCRC